MSQVDGVRQILFWLKQRSRTKFLCLLNKLDVNKIIVATHACPHKSFNRFDDHCFCTVKSLRSNTTYVHFRCNRTLKFSIKIKPKFLIKRYLIH